MSQTPEQRRASDPAASVWVGASAGTGKTFVLTNRVLRLLLDGEQASPERLLCLTFTKAAAAEMANRINDRLAVWAVCSEEQLERELVGLLDHNPSEDIRQRARKLFAEVLEVPGGLKIQTIHSFCQSLLGRFPIEASLAPHFQVMDELTAGEHLQHARDIIFSEARSEGNTALAEALSHISARVAEQTFAELIQELISERGQLDRLMDRFGTVAEVVFKLRNFLGLRPTETADDVMQAACAEENFDGAGLRMVLPHLLAGGKSDKDKAEVMAPWLSTPDARGALFADYSGAFLTKKGEPLARPATKKVLEACPQTQDILQQEAERLIRINERLALVAMLDNTKALLAIGEAFGSAYGESKKRHAVLDYDDLILTVTTLLGKPDVADWILFKLDGGIDHILIDEAQDTNPEQWQVIRTLAGEFFAGEGSRDVTRTIFAVGDVKQSIYSFQRADPRQFVATRKHFETRAGAVELDFHDVSLDLSFRSTSAVLNVVDRVFEAPEHRLALSFSHEEIIHQPHRSGEAGLVELWPVESMPEEPIEEEWSPPKIQKPSRSPEMRLARRIADTIHGWLGRGEKLHSADRAITPGDILILVRRRGKFDDYLIRALKTRGIPVAGQDKMVLTDQLAVQDLMATGRFVLLPDDDLTLAVVLKSPLVGFSEQDLFDLAHGRKKGESLWASLLKRRGDNECFAAATDYLTSLTNFADYAPPFEFFSYLLGPLGGREKILARLGEEASDPMDEFLSLAMAYEQNNVSSLQGFLGWVGRSKMEIKRDMEQGQDQVRIMTVHGAKGLQAPIVFLPDTCQVPSRDKKILWAEQDGVPLMLWPGSSANALGPAKEVQEENRRVRDEEYLRLLYVALTRAEDRLYVAGWEGKQGRKDGSWYSLVEQALRGMDGIEELQGWNDQPLLRFANPQEKEIKRREIDVTTSIVLPPLPAWARAVPEAEPVPPRPLTPSRPVEEEPAVLSPLTMRERQAREEQRFHRGRLIHRLLEILPGLEPGTRENAAGKYLSQPAHGLSGTDQAQIAREVTTLLEDARFAALFGPESRAEVPVVGLVGTTPVSGQVDRLVKTDGEILIVDYKTNRPPPSSADKVPALYLRQMAAYRHILRDIYPGYMIRTALLWTDVAKLMELPDDLLDQVNF
ncbi:double-strand break repair helicase AddA [Emcibacter nanhaiensis]|uniref:DNA 3'-5' helicase n=1 Tax=Emcibacter nanhaiensis TaxID=1505037 RepID=A0A501PP09_9PROT|nr:double-strand break repair helicase AddA [Emcibacter nanhaiensis]TPD61842.1 double-strand break repair helicase AddA [Emcibacter nanhaiensis]